MKTVTTIFDFIADKWPVISPIIYEIIVRIYPTGRNLSLLDNAFKLLSWIIPNNSTHKTSIISSEDPTTSKTTNKHVLKLIAIFMLCSVGSFAQLNYSAKSYRSYGSDSATTKSEVRVLNQNIGTGHQTGALYYNTSSKKWRVFSDSLWFDMNMGAPFALGNGSATTANINHVDWGGTLNSDAIIIGNSASVELGQSGNEVFNFRVYADNEARVQSLNGISFISGGVNAGVFNSSTNGVQLTSAAFGELLMSSAGNVFTDNKASKSGIKYAASGYETDPLSLVTKNYVDTKLLVPAGSTTQIQYNNAGAFGASADFVYNSSNKRVFISSNPGGASGGLFLTTTDGSPITASIFSNNTLTFGDPAQATETINGALGNATHNNGNSLIIRGGLAYSVSGNGNGGDLVLTGSDPRGSGTPGNVQVTGSATGGDVKLIGDNPNGSYIIISGIPTTCVGAPTGALANVAGTLTICP